MKMRTPTSPNGIAAAIRERIKKGAERLWCLEDFSDLAPTAVAQTLSRLARLGEIERLSKGVYYRPRQTVFGKSRPHPTAIQKLVSSRKKVFPSGNSAANLLGFSTQIPRKSELGTSSLSLPRKLIGQETTIHARRPEAWKALSETDAALLDFLRRRGKPSELSSKDTLARVLKLLSERDRFNRLVQVCDTEPPRIRAILGALGEQLGKSPKLLKKLRDNLNPFSQFDFGVFAELPNARNWQARRT